MAGSEFEREVKDTVVRSGLTGVAATVLAVTICSPAGLGGLVGTSLASGAGGDPNGTAANNPLAHLPAYPTPLTTEEVEAIRGEIASTSASMAITRAATNPRIERVRSLAMADGLVSFSNVSTARVAEAMPAPVLPQIAEATPPATSVAAPVVAARAAPAVIASTPVSYVSVEGGDKFGQSEFTHLEFAELLLADEQL